MNIEEEGLLEEKEQASEGEVFVEFAYEPQDPAFRESLVERVDKAPRYMLTKELRGLRTEALFALPGVAEEAKRKLLEYCLPNIVEAIKPYWAGRYGIADEDLLDYAQIIALKLSADWNGERTLLADVNRQRIENCLRSAISRSFGITPEHLPVAKMFWKAAHDLLEDDSLPPSINEVFREVRKKCFSSGLSYKPDDFDLNAARPDSKTRLEAPSRALANIYERVFPGVLSSKGAQLTDSDRRHWRDELYMNLLGRDLQEQMATLSPRERQVLLLKYWEGMSFKEVGEKMGITLEKVRQLESRALRRLRHPYRSSKVRDYLDIDSAR